MASKRQAVRLPSITNPVRFRPAAIVWAPAGWSPGGRAGVRACRTAPAVAWRGSPCRGSVGASLVRKTLALVKHSNWSNMRTVACGSPND